MENRIKKMVFVCNGHDEMLIRWAVGTLADAISQQGIITKVIDLAKGGDERECSNADVVVVYRSFDYRTTRLMRRVSSSGRYVVFFLDDYLFQPNSKYTCGWTAPTDFLKEADCLMSSSNVLLSKMVSHKPKILRRSVLNGEAMGILNQEYRRKPEVFSIGWVAGKGRQKMMDGFISQFLQELNVGMGGEWWDGPAKKGGVRCQFHCFGSRCFPSFPNLEIREHLYFHPDDWKGLYSKCVALDFGVMINPLDESDEFCHCKSELKLVESGAMGVPLVTSRIPPFTEILTEGENGLFASTPREFAEKVLMVMRNNELARKISFNAKKLVVEGYNVTENAKTFVEDVMRARRGIV